MNVSPLLNGNTLFVSGEARNNGSRDTRPFSARLQSWQVLFDNASQQCLTDPNDPAVRNDTSLYVVNKQGFFIQFTALPRDAAGNFVVSNVVAIYRPTAGVLYNDMTFLNLTLPATAGQSSPRRSTLGNFSFAIPATRPLAFAYKLTVDSSGQITEANESDNAFTECDVVLP